jgi:hypothetical protein
LVVPEIHVKMKLLPATLFLLSIARQVFSQSAYIPTEFGPNGFANWGAGNWPPSNVGIPLVPQSTDPETLSLLQLFDPNRIQ